VRLGSKHVRKGGSITVTTGALARKPMIGGAAISLVNGALESFVRAAALELPELRVNAVSPGWVKETMVKMGVDPKPGTYDMKDFIQWVYFNPRIKKYDTLKSKVSLVINGESMKNDFISSSDGGSFYDRIATADNTLQPNKPNPWFKMGINALALLMIGASVWLMFRK
jgi:hypothetical protein